jgi:hypothetical protein
MGRFLLWLTRGKIAGITLSPFGIYFKQEWYMQYPRLVNHEKIHWRQQLEMLIIFFYVWYVLEWFIKFFTPPVGAYIDISFEREAHSNDDNLDYLETRKCYSWFKYLFKNNP